MKALINLKNQIQSELSKIGYELITSFEGQSEHICHVKNNSGITVSIVFSGNEKSRNHGIKFFTNGWLIENSFNQLMYMLDQPGYSFDGLNNRYIKIKLIKFKWEFDENGFMVRERI